MNPLSRFNVLHIFIHCLEVIINRILDNQANSFKTLYHVSNVTLLVMALCTHQTERDCAIKLSSGWKRLSGRNVLRTSLFQSSCIALVFWHCFHYVFLLDSTQLWASTRYNYYSIYVLLLLVLWQHSELVAPLVMKECHVNITLLLG